MALSSSRRVFLKSSALAVVTFGAIPRSLLRAVYAAAPAGRRKTTVVIFQRGACDGLNTVAPYADEAYRRARPSLALAAPGREGGVLDLDGYFGLHPALVDLHPLYKDGALAVVQAAGSPDSTRSHFDAQDFMESGTPGVKSTHDGWMNRACSHLAPFDSRFRSVALTQSLPRILRGSAPAVALARIDDFQVREDIAMSEGRMTGGRGRRGGMSDDAPARRARAADPGAADALEKMYADAAKDLVGNSGRETFDAVEALKHADPAKYQPRPGVAYPRNRLGDGLRQIAQLVKADLGVELAFVDIGGWDHHTAQGAATGQLANLLRQLGGSLAAFHKDLGERMSDVVVTTMTEFGRTVRENGNRGTDHGHASVSFVLGGSVRGGKVHGRWPGLSEDTLFEGRDLAVTTDFRDLCGEIVTKHNGVADLRPVFPGFKPAGLSGLFRS